jgi:GNAT superfamily N-acetyltransferase
MIIREARLTDIPAMAELRNSVRENALSDPGRVTPQDYENYLTRFGKGWVAEENGQITGFAIAGLEQRNIWALFVKPGFEGRGIGRQLQDVMLSWYFAQTDKPVWLSTGGGTRAERFYRNSGWQETGRDANGEIRFERHASSFPVSESR